jgi:hypothetical protein
MNLRQVYLTALQEAVRAGLRPDERPARAHAWATAVLAANGFGLAARPDITSGYRSPARQRELIRRWDAGQRAGFIGRPARCSWHMSRRAIDVQTDVQGFRAYEYLVTKYTGARSGREFDDTGHFDWPAGSRTCV